MCEDLNKRRLEIAKNTSLWILLLSGAFFVGLLLAPLLGGEEVEIDYIINITLITCSMCAMMFAAKLIFITKANVMKGIEKFCQNTSNPDLMMKCLEKVWHEGYRFNKGRMTTRLIINQYWLHSKVISLENAIWVYRRVDRAKGITITSESLVVCYIDGRKQAYRFDVNALPFVVNYIEQNIPGISIGYSKGNKTLYKHKCMGRLKP